MRGMIVLVGVCLAAGVGACGGGGEEGSSTAGGERNAAFQRNLAVAQRPAKSDFPQPRGKTLQEVADNVQAVQAGLATSKFTPGRNRLAFGVIGSDNKLVYGPSAVYLARTPNDPAQGPFPAPADPLVVDPPFRSKQAALESDAVAAIYQTEVSLPRPGPYAVLVLTKRADGSLVGAGIEIQVKRSSPIPEVGERPPRVDTDTIAGGDIESIETRDPGDDMHADGRKIAFMSDRKTARNPDPSGSRGPDFEIFVMNADGSNPRQLTFNSLDDEDPAWSPDGSRIVFQRDLDPVRGETDYDLLTMNADGSGEANLTNSPGVLDSQPSWAPNGRAIAFTSDRGGGDAEIFKMSPDGSNVQKLTNNKLNDEFPNWSPSGRKIVFHRERNDNFDVYTIRARGGSLRRLTRSAAGDGVPAFSPNGRRIAFISDGRGDSPDIFTMRAGGRAQRNRTDSKAFDWAPDWQPTRRR